MTSSRLFILPVTGLPASNGGCPRRGRGGSVTDASMVPGPTARGTSCLRCLSFEHASSLLELLLRDLASGEALRQDLFSVGRARLVLSLIRARPKASCSEDHQGDETTPEDQHHQAATDPAPTITHHRDHLPSGAAATAVGSSSRLRRMRAFCSRISSIPRIIRLSGNSSGRCSNISWHLPIAHACTAGPKRRRTATAVPATAAPMITFGNILVTSPV